MWIRIPTRRPWLLRILNPSRIASAEAKCEVEAQANTTSDLRRSMDGWMDEEQLPSDRESAVRRYTQSGAKRASLLGRLLPNQLHRVERADDHMDASLVQQVGTGIASPDERRDVIACPD